MAFACALAGVCALVLGACESKPAPFSARAWPEADALFEGHATFLGADAAYSVPLGGDRTLFLFGDTFVATSAARSRAASILVRNSIGLVTGSDPSHASFDFRASVDATGAPSSFFAERGDTWLWPLHGVRVPGGPLVLFMSRVVNAPGGLGFRADGPVALVIDESRLDDGAGERFVAVQSRGFGATTIAVRFADHPEGPFSDLVDAYTPPESSRDGVIVYAGKAHPELMGADLIVTYAANALDFGTLVRDDTLYFPRFVRLDRLDP